MTGFGAGRGETAGEALSVELRSVNGKFCEVKPRLPRELSALEPELVKTLKARVNRGVVEAFVRRDSSGLAQEVALIADRTDVAEELTRLASHLSQARELIGSDAPAGRKLEFLVQEVNREINTIGSKSQHAGIAALVVDLKAELERIREQVQNVE